MIDPSTCTELRAEGIYTLCSIWNLIKLETKKVRMQTRDTEITDILRFGELIQK